MALGSGEAVGRHDEPIRAREKPAEILRRKRPADPRLFVDQLRDRDLDRVAVEIALEGRVHRPPDAIEREPVAHRHAQISLEELAVGADRKRVGAPVVLLRVRVSEADARIGDDGSPAHTILQSDFVPPTRCRGHHVDRGRRNRVNEHMSTDAGIRRQLGLGVDHRRHHAGRIVVAVDQDPSRRLSRSCFRLLCDGWRGDRERRRN